MTGYDQTRVALTVVEKLWGQVLADSERIAVESQAGSLSYRELWDRSVTIGSILRDQGVTTDSVVGILTESTLELEVAVWGVLQSGGAYLPLSPEYPRERLRYMIGDSHAVAILTTRALAKEARAIGGADVNVLCVEDYPIGDGSAEDEIPVSIDPSDLAYMIYTSGSTGKPKGVMIEHRSIGNQMGWMRDDMGISRSDCVLQKTPFSFDAAQWEILAVAIGATVTMAGVGDYRDPGKLIATANDYGVTTIQCVPTLWAALVETEGFADLNLIQLFSGGEVLTAQLARELKNAHPDARMVNLYGPTETTINVTAHVVEDDDLGGADQVVPIGSAVRSTELLVLDNDLHDVEAGEIGELCIAGIQLARGYAGQPQQTAERFPHHVDARGVLRRIYRTGDLARRGASGTVSFIGRRDNQVKVNGHRIELDEVRLAVESHRWIRQAVVVPWTTRGGGTQLAAFIELDKKEAALMDQGAHDGHHQSKVSKVAVLAQLSHDGVRTVGELEHRPVIDLPHREASETQIESAFDRKTYRTFRGEIDSTRIAEVIRVAIDYPFRTENAQTDSYRELLGVLLRWFGPFTSAERLLPKYAYASPGALNATQIYLELAGVTGMETGVYYFHPLQHQLVRVAHCAEGDPRIRMHLVGKRERIEEVYSTNVDEVLHLEAGHMLGLLDEVAGMHAMSVIDASAAPAPLIDVLSTDGYVRSACVDLVAGGVGYLPGRETTILVQIHRETTDGLRPGMYRFTDGILEPFGTDVVRRKDVIAINQAVYDQSTFGIALLMSRQTGWSGFVEHGRMLHRLQRNVVGVGLMSSGYSSLTGHDLASAVRLQEILGSGAFNGAGTSSYFALGGGIGSDQRSSRGMDEDIVHMRGPAEILRDDLRELLPEYMVPTRVTVVDDFARTVNGKFDLKKLREAAEAEEAERELVLPRTGTENAIAQIWASLLPKDFELSVKDSFFHVGGNSLKGVSLIHQLNARFGLRLPLQALFTASTIEALALEVESGASAPMSRLVPLNNVQQGRPVFCWPGLGGYPMSLRGLGSAAGGDTHSFVGVQAQGINSGEHPFETVQEMAAADVDLILQAHSAGPITCLGYSFGARVAFEAVYQLEQLGHTVDQLIMLAPGSPLARTDGAGGAGSDRAYFLDERFLRILLTVFTGTATSPYDGELLEEVSDEASFVEFLTRRFDHLSAELVSRIVDIVTTTYSFEYTFDELYTRAIKAPITIIKAQGDDYSFLEGADAFAATMPTTIELPYDHYSVVRGAGLPELVQALTTALSRTATRSIADLTVGEVSEL